MNKKLWLVSIALAIVGLILGFSLEKSAIGEIGWFIACLGFLGIVIGAIADYLGLKIDTSKIKEKPKEVLLKVLKSLIVVSMVIVCGAIVYDHIDERTISMIGGGIILVSLGAIWKPIKTSSSKQEKKTKDEHISK